MQVLISVFILHSGASSEAEDGLSDDTQLLALDSSHCQHRVLQCYSPR